jgi:hypothetical protein
MLTFDFVILSLVFVICVILTGSVIGTIMWLVYRLFFSNQNQRLTLVDSVSIFLTIGVIITTLVFVLAY